MNLSSSHVYQHANHSLTVTGAEEADKACYACQVSTALDEAFFIDGGCLFDGDDGDWLWVLILICVIIALMVLGICAICIVCVRKRGNQNGSYQVQDTEEGMFNRSIDSLTKLPLLTTYLLSPQFTCRLFK